MPLGKAKLPAETFPQLERSLERLRSHLDRSDLTPNARLIIENFALPDPDRLPEFYRTYSRKKEPQLLIVWGCNLSKSDFIAPSEAIAKLGRESGLARFLRKALPYILGLLLLTLIAFLIWLYLCLPDVDLKLSKDKAAPHEPIRAFVSSEKGDTFVFEAIGASLIDSQPDNRVVGNSIPEWKKTDPVTSAPQAKKPTSVAVAAVDRREYLIKGEVKPNYVGLTRSGFGIPYRVGTKSGAPLAQDLGQSIAESLNASGYTAQDVTGFPIVDPLAAKAKLLSVPADRHILVTVSKWESDTLVRTELVTDISISVFDKSGKLLATKSFADAKTFPGDLVNPTIPARRNSLEETSRILSGLLTSPEIAAAL